MLKNIGAGIAGIVIAGLVIMLVEMIGHTVYPPPPDLDFTDTAAMSAYVAALPAAAFLFVIVAWGLGACFGTLVACKIGNARPVVFACVVGGAILAGVVYNLATIPHPIWVAIAGIGLTVSGAWLGISLGRSRSEAPE